MRYVLAVWTCVALLGCDDEKKDDGGGSAAQSAVIEERSEELARVACQKVVECRAIIGGEQITSAGCEALIPALTDAYVEKALPRLGTVDEDTWTGCKYESAQTSCEDLCDGVEEPEEEDSPECDNLLEEDDDDTTSTQCAPDPDAPDAGE